MILARDEAVVVIIALELGDLRVKDCVIVSSRGMRLRSMRSYIGGLIATEAIASIHTILCFSRRHLADIPNFDLVIEADQDTGHS